MFMIADERCFYGINMAQLFRLSRIFGSYDIYFSVSTARKVMSSKLPIGVGTRYRVPISDFPLKLIWRLNIYSLLAASFSSIYCSFSFGSAV